MRIGVFFNSNPTDGGGFQQKIMVLDILKEKNDNYDLKLICSNKDVICNYSSEYDIINIYEWFKLFRFLKFINQIKIRTLLENLLIYILRYQLKKKCDILYYLGPTDLSFRIGIPYIFTVNDLMHRYYPNFPEISQNNEYDRREYMYSNGFKYALAIVTDSEIGKEDVIN